MQNLAEIHLWGQLVGALAYDPASGLSTFEYAPEWVATGIEIAPLHMPLPTGSRKFQFPQLNPATYKGLPAVFADTLPDDFGNAVIDAWLARTGRAPGSFNALERLLYTGNRGMGALEYAPAIQRKPNKLPEFELDSLISMAQQVLDQRAGLVQTVDEDDHQDALATLLQVGTSAGGARAKAIIAINSARTEIRSGQLDAPDGFEHCLLKFDGVVESSTRSEIFGDPQGFSRMEYAYYRMAVDAGIAMSPCELLFEGQRAHFLTRRFDRAGNRKLHYQSLCAMDHVDYKLPGSYSYEQLLGVARQLRLPRADAVEIYRRMVFNVIARNHDDHSKNFGFLLADTTSNWRLAPAFDVAYSYRPGSPWVNAHQLSIGGKRDQFTYDDLLAVANLIGNFAKDARQIISQVQAVVSEWDSYARQAGVFEGLQKEIQRNLRIPANGYLNS